MKVLIDGHMINTNEGGNERYTKNLYKSLVKLRAPGFQPAILLKSGLGNNDLCRLLYFIPRLVSKNKIDVVHSNYIGPFIKDCKSVIVVHDLSFRPHPDFYGLKDKLIFNVLLPYSLNSADAIVVPSHFIKKEFVKYYPKYIDKLFVIPEASDDSFFPVSKVKAQSVTTKKFNISSFFLLTINSRNPKKNINRICEAFVLLNKKFLTLNLIIVGGDYNVKPEYKRMKNIKILDYIKDADLNWFYNAAAVFIYYSIYEGFGLPIIEALKCNTLVIASDIEVHREITKNLITYADPYNPEDLQKKVTILLTNKNKADKIRAKSSTINTWYDWTKTAKLTLDVYKKIYQS